MFRSWLPQPSSSQNVDLLSKGWATFDLIKAEATQTKTPLLKQHDAGERVDLLDDYNVPARSISESADT